MTISAPRCLALLLFVLPALTGCFSTMAPKRPQTLAPAVAAYPAREYSSDVATYRDDIKTRDYTGARALRDQIVYRALADIESGYGRFEVQLTTSRASESVLADTAQLGLTAATTVAAAGDVKDILAASLSGLQGTQLSLDKNFFREKTTEALISQMRADRKNLEAQIITRLATQDVIASTDPASSKAVAAYPLDAAWIDVIQYYYAGTVPSALVSIATATGNNASTAATNLTNTVQSLVPATPQQRQDAMSLSQELEKLYSAAQSKDPATSKSGTKSLTNILTKIGKLPAGTPSADDLVNAMVAAARSANPAIPGSDKALAAKILQAVADEKSQ